MGGTSRTGTVDSSGTYYSSIVGTVVATQAYDEVVFVGLYEGTTLLTSTSYQADLSGNGLPTNNPRNFALGANLPPGTHNLYVHAITYNDLEGNSLTYPFTISAATAVDGATFVSQSSIPTSMVVGQSYSVSLTFKNSGSSTWLAGGANPYRLGAQSPENNSNFGINRVGVGSDVAPGAQRTFTFTVTPSQTGTFTFQWRMLTEGYTWFGDYSPAVTVKVDPQPPVPTFTQPTSDVSVVASGTTANVAFAGSATASGGATMSKLELIEAGTVFATGTSSASASKALTVGTHIIQLKATDSRGTTAIATRTVTVTGPPPPVPTFTQPTSDITVAASGTSATVAFSGSATASGGATMSKLELIEAGTTFATGTSSVSASKALGVGSHTIQLKATDSVGTTAIATRTVTVTGGLPTVSISSPSNGASFNITSGTNVSVPVSATATASGGATINVIRLYVDGAVNQSAAGGTLNASVVLPEGAHTLSVDATDSNGAISAQSSVNITVVGSTPTVTITSPADGAVTATSSGTAGVLVKGTAVAVGGSSISVIDLLDNGSVITSAGGTTNFASTVYLMPGTHTLTLRATNAAYKQGVSQPVTITIKAASSGLGATFVSPLSVPSTMRAGQPYTITVQMLNSGTTTWTPSGTNPVRLGTQNAQDNKNWNVTGRAYLTGPVATGQTATFTIPITAPATPGTYNMQWQMLAEFLNWFGDFTPNQVVTVSAGAGPTAALSATPTNVRVSGTQTAAIAFTASSTASSGTTLRKFELFQGTYSTDFSSSTPIASTTLSTSSATWTPSVSLPAGAYLFKVRSTDSNGVATDSKPVVVNVTNSALLGTTSGVRTNAANNLELFGWVCKSGSSAALSFKALLDAPSPDAGGLQLTTGTANVATEPDNAAVQSTCATPGAAHHFVVDLSPYLAQYAGRSIYVWAETADHSQNVTLPCPDNGCTMPGTLRVALTTPLNGDKISYPNPVFVRMLTNSGAAFDEVGFYVNGKWVAAQPDGAAGAYSASVSGLAASATPYTVYAKARQGNTTVLSVQNQFTVVSGSTISLTSPGSGASLTVGTAQSLSATATGTVQTVKFFANGTQIATGSAAGSTWNASWTPTTAGTVSLTAIAYDSAGAQVAQSTAVSVTIAADPGNSATPISVAVTPPHLGNADAGTLPGQINIGNDGAATYGIELAVPPGTAGMQPKLSLTYSSNGANGMVGLGWSLGGLSTIHRCAKTMAQDGIVGRIGFNTSDRLCLDGTRLFRSDGTNPGSTPAAQDSNYWVVGAQYRTEIEGFAQVTRLSNGFRVEFKDGRVQYYGQNADASDTSSAIPAQGRSGETLLWALARTEDRSGNYLTVQYTTDTSTGEYVPTQIRYGGNTTANQSADLAVRFVYEVRPDSQIQYMGGSRNDLRRRLTNVQTFINTAADGSGGTRVRNYIIRYVASANSGRSLVDSVQVCAATDSECLPKTSMTWGSNPMKLVLKEAWKEYVSGDGETFPYKVVTGDFVGDGTSAYLYPVQGPPTCPTCSGDAGQVRPFTGDLLGRVYYAKVNLPATGDKFTEVMAGDLNGDGRADLVFVDISSRHWAYCLGLAPNSTVLNFSSCQLGPMSLPARRNYEPNTGDLPHLVSLRNDGKVQLLAFDSSNNLMTCSYANNAMTCSTGASVMPSGNPVFDAMPIDLSKQGMTDFYSVWTIQNTTSSGVTVCNFYSNTLTCKNIVTGSGFYGSNPADLNGDGLTDFYYTTLAYNSTTNTSTFTSHACLSKETDVDCNSVVFNGSGGGFSRLIPSVGDFTGNGVNYYVGPSPTNANAPALCYVVDGKSVCVPIDTSAIPDILTKYGYPQSDTTDTPVLDGSGVPSFRACTIPYYDTSRSGYDQDCITYSALLPANEDKLIAVVNGVSQREEVDYARGNDNTVYSHYATVNGAEQRPVYPQLANNPGVMVKQVRRSNGQGGWLSSNYRYAGAMRDGLGRGSLGFTKASVTDANGITTESTFAQTFPFSGMATRVTRTSSTCTLDDTVNTLEQQPFNLGGGGQNFFVDIKQIDVTRRDLDCSDLGTVRTVNQYTDGWGNLNTQTVTSTANSETFTTKTISVFNTSSGKNYLSGLPTSVTVTRTNSKGELLTRSLAYTYDAITGLLKTETIEPNNTLYSLVTTYDRTGNPFGLVGSQVQTWTNPACSDPFWPTSLDGFCGASKTRTLAAITYDTKGRFPETLKNALGHTEVRKYDPGSGAMIKRTDPNNLVTDWTINGFGRVTVERSPDANETRSYMKACAGDCPNGATVAQVTERFNGLARIATPQVVYVDSAGHTVRTLNWGFDGAKIVSDQRYDALGRLSETDWPRFDNATAFLARREGYDDLNRVTSTTSYDEGGTARSSTTEYHGLKTVLTNAKSQVRTEWRDAIGQLRQVDDSNSPIGTTKFEYDPFGNLGKTTDPSQNVITVKYDLRGRKTDLTDPDLGAIHYDVDPVGQVWAQTTPNLRAKGKKTYMSYDLLGRMIGRYESDLESHWTYDAAANGIGQLMEAFTGPSSQKDYSRTHTYDTLGRPRLTTTLLSDGTYTSQIDYDAWGRPVTNTYTRTDKNNVKGPVKAFDSRYNAYGYLARILRGNLVLWQTTAQDAALRPTAVAFGNGLTQATSYYPQTGRLQNATLTTSTGVERLREGYSYDALGNVLQRTQYWDAGGFTETFTYDSLNRVLTSQVPGQPTQSFTYDATGNITSKTGLGVYTYPTPGAAAIRPHAVTGVTSIAGSFQYDNDGNLIAGAGRTVTWNSFDMPTTITKGTASATFVYGPEHQRVRQNRNDGSFLVYAGNQEVETSATSLVTVKTYWPNGVGVEIDRGASATEMSWMHVDRLGSVIALTSDTGAIRQDGKLEYDVWGKRRSTTDNLSTPDSLDGTIDNRGFTGHEMLDQLDLVHMNGRVYNPQLGNFLSGDPFVKDPTNGQNYNRYSYVSNNPTNLTDPTGFVEANSICGTGVNFCSSSPVNPDRKPNRNGDDNDNNSTQSGTASQRPVLGTSNSKGIAPNGDVFRQFLDGYNGDNRSVMWSETSAETVGRYFSNIVDFGINLLPGSSFPEVGRLLAEGSYVAAAMELGTELLGPVGKEAKLIGGAEKAAEKYTVGIYKDIQGTVPGLDAHHVGQKSIMKKLVPGYDPATAPAILVPKEGHTAVGPRGRVSTRSEGLDIPRDVVARDIRELRRVYPDIPNSTLQRIIQMNKDLYPNSFIKKGELP